MTGTSDYLFFAIWLAVAITLSLTLVYVWNSLEKRSNRRPGSPK
jgi:hypothetical protein